MENNINMPLVSCIIPSYKRCDTVVRAIESVLSQTYKNVEVCLVDDNEPGDKFSIKLKESLKIYSSDKRVRYISQNKHINGAVARNVGIMASKGMYICFLDDDDEWMPEKIERQVSFLMENPEYNAVTTLWMECSNNQIIRKCPIYSTNDFTFKIFLREIVVFTSTVLLSASAIKKTKCFDEKLLRHQDLQFLIDSNKVCKFGVVEEYLVKINNDSRINRPNTKKLIEYKKNFFHSVSDSYNSFDKKKKGRIKRAHYYEICFQALKEKRFMLALVYFLKAGIHINSIKDLIKRYKDRKLK